MPKKLESVVEEQRKELIDLLTKTSDDQVAMFRKALDGKYTPKEYTKDVSKLWAANLKGFAMMATGWLAVAEAVANTQRSSESSGGT